MYKLELLETSANVEITVKGEELKEIKEAILKEYKNAKIDGFRKGHAPIDVIEKTFANQIKDEILNKVLRSEYEKALEENEISVLGEVNIVKFEYENDEVNIKLEFEVKPKFEVKDYKGLNIALEVEEVKDETVEEKLKNVAARQKKFEKIERTVAEDKDIANINFEGFVDGVAFEGGKAEGYDLVLGSKSFIDNFEEQIIGKNVNDEFEVNVKFPEEYHAENLKGKDAVFKVKLNALKVEVLPEINDEFAKLNGYDSLDEYKKVLRAELEADAERRAKDKKYEKIADKLVEETEMVLPVNVVESEKNNQKNGLLQQLSSQGLKLEDFLKMSGKTEEEFDAELDDRAKKIVKFNLVINKIAEIEGIKVESSEIDKELENLGAMYNMTREQIVEELKKAKLLENYANQMASTVFMRKIKEFLVENN